MVKWKSSDKSLVIYLKDEIDHHAAEKLRNDIENLIKQQQPKILTLDFTDVTFMDSSGVGMLIGRYKTMAANGGQVFACGLSETLWRLFRMAGLHRIIQTACVERSKEV